MFYLKINPAEFVFFLKKKINKKASIKVNIIAKAVSY